LKKHYGSDAKLAEVNKKLRERMGAENKVLGETLVPYIMAPDTIYSRRSDFSNVRVPVVTTITMNQRGEVDLFTIGPESPVSEGRYAGYTDTTKLKLPSTASGWCTRGTHNLRQRLCRFRRSAVCDGLRLFERWPAFLRTRGPRSKSTDYYCFGQPIVAPADGTVVKAEGAMTTTIRARTAETRRMEISW